MVSQETVFKLFYNAAKCFIPTDELTEDQLEKLENITLESCSCKLCKRFDGHADIRKLKVYWSKPRFFKTLNAKRIFNGYNGSYSD